MKLLRGAVLASVMFLWPMTCRCESSAWTEGCGLRLRSVASLEDTAECRASVELRRFGGPRQEVAGRIFSAQWPDALAWGRSLARACAMGAIRCSDHLETARRRLGGESATGSEKHVLGLIRQAAYLGDLSSKARGQLFIDVIRRGEVHLPDGSYLSAGDAAFRAFEQGHDEVLTYLLGEREPVDFVGRARLIRVWSLVVEPKPTASLARFLTNLIEKERASSGGDLGTSERAEAVLVASAIRSRDRRSEVAVLSEWLEKGMEERGSRPFGDLGRLAAELCGDVGNVELEKKVLGRSAWSEVAVYEAEMVRRGRLGAADLVTEAGLR